MSNATSKPRRTAPCERCTRCSEPLTVRWRGRWWCVKCDDAELFGETRQRRQEAQR